MLKRQTRVKGAVIMVGLKLLFDTFLLIYIFDFLVCVSKVTITTNTCKGQIFKLHETRKNREISSDITHSSICLLYCDIFCNVRSCGGYSGARHMMSQILNESDVIKFACNIN